MSNILKGIINETSPHDYDSDWDYQDALARSGKTRSGHRSPEDDTFDSDVAYSKKIYQATKAAKEKAQRDADHNRLATGTNESLDDPWGDQGNFAGSKPFNLGGVAIKNIQVGDTVKYLGQPSKVVAMSKDRKYSRITISKGMGSVTQDVLTSDLQKLGQGVKEEQLDEISNEKLAQYKTAAAADAGKADKEGDYKRGDKRFSGIVKATKKQFANDTKKSGISQGISEEAPRFNSKQEVINHFVKNGKSAAAGAAAWERGWRGSSPKKPIEFKKPPQRSYHDELDDKRYTDTFENLGDQLKSNSLNALVQAKLAIEKQREADIEAWKQDFEKNTVQKAQQGLRKEFQPTPVAQPGEKHSALKARLSQLNSAIQKQELLDKLVDRLERRGLMTPAMQNDADTRMHVRYGAKDNYESLNKKLDNAIATLQNRLNIRKISGLKEEGHDERDEYDNPRQGRDYGKGNLFVDPGSTEFKKEVHIGSNDGERGRPKNLKGVSKSLPADAFGRTTGKIPDSAKPTSKDDPFKDLDENLHKWFQEKWVRFGPDGKIRGDCARGDDSEGKPKCLPQSKAQNLGKKGRASAAARKRREDPNPERSGKAINVNTKKKTNEEQLDELSCWSGYHRVKGTKAGFPGSCAKNTNEEQEHNETCPHCGGEMVSEELMNEKKDACYYKVKSRYKVWPSAYASGALVKCRKKGASNWGTGGKKLKEFTADDDSGGEEDTLRKYAKMWYNGDLGTQKKVEQILDRMGWEIGELESEEGGAFVVQAGDEHGNSYIGFTADDLTNNLEEKWTKKYKDSINCSNPKGFSQKAHCAGKNKNESAIMKGLKND